MSDREQDWIAKYRAALVSEPGRKSPAGAVIAALRRAWRWLGLKASPNATGFSGQAHEPESPALKKVAHREVPPAPEDRDTKAS